MHIEMLQGIAGARQARGLAVIIDVFRAFSTACYVVKNGAREILPVGDLASAHRLKEEVPERVLMGERGGKIQPGFDYGNSPTQVAEVDFRGRSVIQTTSSGTQGLVNAKDAKVLVSGSFVNAEAVIAYIEHQKPRLVSLVSMGTAGIKPNTEDTLCARYLRDRLTGKDVLFDPIAAQIRRAPSARKFFDPAMAWAPEMDVNLCLNLNACKFVLRADRCEDEPLRLVPVAMN